MEYREAMDTRWRKELFKICVVLAIIGTAAEIIIYLHDASHQILFLSGKLYRFRFIYFPSALNFAVVVFTYRRMQSKNISSRAKNAWVCILIYFLCANTQVIHYVYGPLLMLPSIAVFVSALFSDKRLTFGLMMASFGSLFIAWHQASIELRKGDQWLNTDAVLAALVILVTYIVARLLIAYVSEQMNYILASNERQKILIEECNMDPLMGIGNRRALNKKMKEEQLQDYQIFPPQLLMMDIDDFKKINDTYGHLCGDEVLIELAQIVKERAQEERIEAYRYGGEEIVLLFREMDERSAYLIAEEIRMIFSKKDYSFDSKVRTTLSAGMATLEKNFSMDKWVEKADEKLYQAKKDGKNRVYGNMRMEIYAPTGEKENMAE